MRFLPEDKTLPRTLVIVAIAAVIAWLPLQEFRRRAGGNGWAARRRRLGRSS